VSTLAEQWQRIDAWLAAHAACELSASPPISPQGMSNLEAALGRPLPLELAQWLAIHDGAQAEVWTTSPEQAWTLFRSKQIEEGWKALQKLFAELATELGPETLAVRAIGPVSAVFWKPAWIPFATNGAGDRLCFDMAPEPGGVEGQIVLYLRDPAPRQVVAPSLTALLSAYADALERGAYRFEPYVGLVPCTG
jgi:cell wall assembly regulator SMI1